jgi:hypothetical protein
MAGQRRQDEAGTQAHHERRHGAARAAISFEALGGACSCAAQAASYQPPACPDDSTTPADGMPRLENIRRVVDSLENIRRVQDAMQPALAVAETWRLARVRAQQAAAAAASAVHGWQEVGHAVTTWVKQTLARRPPTGPVIDPATDPVDPALILEAEEQAAELETRFALVATTFTPRQQIAWDLRDQPLGVLAARLGISTPAAKQLRRRTWDKVFRRIVA